MAQFNASDAEVLTSSGFEGGRVNSKDWVELAAATRGKKSSTILADPPWQFQNRAGKVGSLAT